MNGKHIGLKSVPKAKNKPINEEVAIVSNSKLLFLHASFIATLRLIFYTGARATADGGFFGLLLNRIIKDKQEVHTINV